MLDYSELDNLSEETQMFIDRTLYYLSRNIQMFVIQDGHINREYYATNRDEIILAMLAAYRELSHGNEAFLDANGVKTNVRLSMKRLVTEFSEEEKKKTYLVFVRHFNIKDTDHDISPEMILSRNLKKFLKSDVNNDFKSNLFHIFGSNMQMLSFSNALFDKAKEKFRKESYTK